MIAIVIIADNVNRYDDDDNDDDSFIMLFFCILYT